MRFNMMKRKKGAALLIAIIAGMLLTILCGMMLTALNNELKIRKVTEERMVAKYLAEGGIEHGLYIYSTTPNLSTGTLATSQIKSGTTVIGQYVVNYYIKGSTYPNNTLISTGTTQAGKIMKIQVQIDTTGSILDWKEIP